MRLLPVINPLDPAGPEILLRGVALGLARRGVETAVYLLRSTDSPLERGLAEAGIPLHCSRAGPVGSPQQVVALARHLRAHAYDVVHAHLFPTQLWGALAARLAAPRTPLLTTEHATHNRRRRRLLQAMDRWMYGNYRHVVCVSHAVAAALARWVPAVEPRLRVIPNGIDVGRFAGAERGDPQRLLGVAGPVLMMVARFEPARDQATLLRAMRHLNGAQLVLVGDGSRRAEHQRLAAALGVAERCHFLGTRKDVERLIKLADVYVQSSHWEGFGIAVLEAMASGVPVVASRVPGLVELVDSAGVLVEPGNADHLAQVLNALLRDPERRAELARRGRARADAFRIDGTVDRYHSLYREVCRAPADRRASPD